MKKIKDDLQNGLLDLGYTSRVPLVCENEGSIKEEAEGKREEIEEEKEKERRERKNFLKIGHCKYKN